MQEEEYLRPRAANHVPLTPLEFLRRAVEVFPARPAVAWNGRLWTYREFDRIVARLAVFLLDKGTQPGDVISVMASNRPEMLAAHYAVPIIGAVLNTINTRLDVEAVGYILKHSKCRLMISEQAFWKVAQAAATSASIELHWLADCLENPAEGLDVLTDGGGPHELPVGAVFDEWQPLCLNYTSGTTGKPKGVVYHHRGAYLNAIGNVLALGLTPRSVYLWTLPMFHCNGWCHTWAVTAAGGLHVCLDRPEPALIFRAIAEHKVTHLSCAPVVLYMMLNHPAREMRLAGDRVVVATGGAAPTSALIAELDALGFDLTHLYGLTESYGPETLRQLDEYATGLPAAQKAAELAKQGVRHITASRITVIDEQGREVPADGVTMGEIALAGNTMMAGYYREAIATEKAFEGGMFRTGDLAVRHPDGNIEIRDRSKDIIISGGENISSLEVESVLHRHPAVLLAAVVAAPHEKWGETPVAFIELRDGVMVTVEELRAFCKQQLAGFKVSTLFIFSELPKTATGKIQKFLLREEARALADRDGIS
ncbi:MULTISPECIES: AMP-binding protein [unclassified Mesorhizobium]|uniref:AMP-binding protein n=1 Tax=unclassified Mesorhizobium TaxID=325217 RepID=UPI000FDB3EBF|nr:MULTISPECIES: AMP-binding protein [unclassified Mesorhizobium]TGT71896.1 acyl-CoA synthase [Mesorhizobium sp. M2E.F.Ca.ET.166.01.1.1]TGV99389.1 acyl-CoA synthase [Mesorhizobium sp. M2E.F.Ca.ET.154.01.1.1]